jgi:peptidoglycan/xylan/chitin deacetylase (PgdA/CDA1 family)
LRRARDELIGTLTNVRTSEPVAALTFDDGPHPEFTPGLLEVLAAHGARATFFMVGEHAAEHPDIVSRVHEAGHAVANHTWSHARLPALSHRRRREELRRCQAALGTSPTRLFRPPRGLQSRRSYVTARISGYDVVGWSVQAEDWLDRSADEIAEDLGRRIRPGSIVLLHDRLADPSVPSAADRTRILRAVDRTLDSLTGFRFVTVPDLLAAGQPVREPWFIRTDDDWNRNLDNVEVS